MTSLKLPEGRLSTLLTYALGVKVCLSRHPQMVPVAPMVHLVQVVLSLLAVPFLHLAHPAHRVHRAHPAHLIRAAQQVLVDLEALELVVVRLPQPPAARSAATLHHQMSVYKMGSE